MFKHVINLVYTYNNNLLYYYNIFLVHIDYRNNNVCIHTPEPIGISLEEANEREAT